MPAIKPGKNQNIKNYCVFFATLFSLPVLSALSDFRLEIVFTLLILANSQ